MYAEIKIYDDDGRPLETAHIIPPIITRERTDALTDSIIRECEWRFAYRKREIKNANNR